MDFSEANVRKERGHTLMSSRIHRPSNFAEKLEKLLRAALSKRPNSGLLNCLYFRAGTLDILPVAIDEGCPEICLNSR